MRPLYFYYLAKDAAKVQPFIDHILTDKGQQIVSDVGYISLR